MLALEEIKKYGFDKTQMGKAHASLFDNYEIES